MSLLDSIVNRLKAWALRDEPACPSCTPGTHPKFARCNCGDKAQAAAMEAPKAACDCEQCRSPMGHLP